jgi:hypothetical protein
VSPFTKASVHRQVGESHKAAPEVRQHRGSVERVVWCCFFACVREGESHKAAQS